MYVVLILQQYRVMRSFMFNICLKIRTLQISPNTFTQPRLLCCSEKSFDVSSIFSSLSLPHLGCLSGVDPELRHAVRLRQPLSLALLLLLLVETGQRGGRGSSHHVNSVTGIYGSPGYTEDLDTVPVVPEEQESVKFPVRLRGEATYWWYKG